MKILHITSITNPGGNGVAVAVSNYFKYEKELADVAIYNLEQNIVNNKYSYNITDYEFISELPDGFNSPDLVIFNEVYRSKYIQLYKECLRRKIPYIIIPHGCLTRVSQKKCWLKKKVANLLFFNRFIKKSLAIQFLNEREKNTSIGSYSNYIISGNGVDIIKRKNKYLNKDFVYIGRYDVRHKGLDLLVRAVSDNKKWFIDNGVKVQLYGRDSQHGYDKLKKMITEKDVSNIIVMNGAVYDDDKARILRSAYAFVQPSRFEGQPMGVLEALSYGVPCIVTEGTSFAEYVNKNKCGIGIRFNEKELFDAIKKLYMDEKFRNNCSENTLSIFDEHGWPKVSRNCLAMYRGLI